ncbi:MAG: HPr family phosphocarrier protein [Planctomycetaceae bacterium]|nr:HPr family phosphocarrier protein [Planctomycetaceae bacterium]
MEYNPIAMENKNMYREDVVVNLANGLHLVPCSRISEISRSYGCEIRIYNGEHAVDAKAVFDLMTLRADQGTHLVLEAEGELAEEALEKLVHLFETDFELDRSAG